MLPRSPESLLRYVNQWPSPLFRISEEDNRALLGEVQGVNSEVKSDVELLGGGWGCWDTVVDDSIYP